MSRSPHATLAKSTHDLTRIDRSSTRCNDAVETRLWNVVMVSLEGPTRDTDG